MKTITTPLPVHDDSVMDSDYFEQDTSTPRKHKPHTKRADHKHTYVIDWLEFVYHSNVYNKTTVRRIPVSYCTICGRIGHTGYGTIKSIPYKEYRDMVEAGPKPGAKVFRTHDGGLFKDDRVNLDDFYIQQ